MSNKTIVLFVTLFTLVVVGMFASTYLSKQNNLPVVAVPEPHATTTDSLGITLIEGKHFFTDGVHTIVGVVALPTPCDLLVTEAVVAESYPEQVTFAFSVINTTSVCAHVVTNQRFKVEATASTRANLGATFMGKPVELNLVQAESGETPEEFELYIKG